MLKQTTSHRTIGLDWDVYGLLAGRPWQRGCVMGGRPGGQENSVLYWRVRITSSRWYNIIIEQVMESNQVEHI